MLGFIGGLERGIQHDQCVAENQGDEDEGRIEPETD